MSIKIDKEFESLIPPLSADEIDQLEKNILSDGIRDPLVVWPQGDGDSILVDGHNRWKIAAKNSGVPFKILQKEFKDRDEAKQWIILNQFGRRNLSAYDRSLLALKLKPVIAKKAKEKLSTHTEQGYQKSDKAVHTTEELAKLAGVSHDTIHKVETIENSGNEYIKQAVQSGGISIDQGYRDVKGLNTKSPRQLHKDYIESVKQEREEFQEKKDAGIVSVKDVAKDRENAETIAHELWSRLAKVGKPIADIYMEMREQEINIKEMANILTNSETESLKSRIQMWIYQLNQILEVIES